MGGISISETQLVYTRSSTINKSKTSLKLGLIKGEI